MKKKMPLKDPVVALQFALYFNSFYVNAIDFYKEKTSSLLGLLCVTIIHVMGLYSLYCSGSVDTSPKAATDEKSGCRICKAEVAVRDHHCVYIGQCVGIHNYRHFFSYLFYSYLAATTDIYQTYLLFINETLTWGQMYDVYSFWFKVRLLVFVLSAIWFTFFTGQLLAYQLYMILNGITAREHKKQTKQLLYTFKTSVKALLDSKKRKEMKEAFAARWMFFFRSKYEFLFCELDEEEPAKPVKPEAEAAAKPKPQVSKAK